MAPTISKNIEIKKKAIEEFKKNLKEYITNNGKDHPVVFFIDELDRCNPHFAVSILEKIKHLFDIPNIVFILAINKKELEHAIQGYYGSEHLDSQEYLRRFIDIELTLPQPKISNYCNYLYEQYHYDDFFSNIERKKYFQKYDEKDSFLKMAQELCEQKHTNLRVMDRIFSYTRLALMQFTHNNYLVPDMFFLLCFWKITDRDFYTQIEENQISVQTLLNQIEDKIPRCLIDESDKYRNMGIRYMLAGLLYCYDDTLQRGVGQESIIITDQDRNTFTTKLTPKIIKKEALDETIAFFFHGHENRYNHGLAYIFKKIDLLDSFQV